jgi:tetratricopeptide (TPR) repeat protein
LTTSWLFLAFAIGCGESTNSEKAIESPAAEELSGDSESATPMTSTQVTKPATRDELVQQADLHRKEGRNDKAKELLRELLVREPQDFESVFRLANAVAAEGNLDDAIELLSGIPADHPEAGLPSLGVSGDWCFQAERYAEAESRYLRVLEIDASVNFARRKLAYLYNRQGRRHEAVKLIRELCLSGDVTQDELHSLIVESDAMYDPPGSQPTAGTRPYWPIGAMGRARHLFTEKRYQEAAEVIRPIVESGQASPSVIAFFGRVAVEAQDDGMIALWRSQVNEASKQYPEHWAALGTHLIHEVQFKPAVRALSEAVYLDPTDLKSIRRLFQGLRSLGREEQAEVWIEHFAFLNRILRQSNLIASTTPSDQDFQFLADDLEKVGRKIEAVLWRSVAATRSRDGRQAITKLKQEMQQTLRDDRAFPNRDQAWLGMNLGEGDLPGFSTSKTETANVDLAKLRKRHPQQSDEPRFVDVTDAIGLDHTYLIAKQPQPKGFAIYQAYGGGVAVLDFDHDGESDLFLAQGAADASDFVATKSDQLYRTMVVNDSKGQRRVVDVTQPAGVSERDFSVGVTAGDWNQDGFTDLAVSNIGINRLLVNQGDGTFRSEALDDVADFERFCTSLAMADVTGDQIPDLFVLNYLRDPDITRLPKIDAQGEVVDAVPPLSFKPSRDQVYMNRGDGTWLNQNVGVDQSGACTGLGVVVTDLNSALPGNEIFVGNDVMRNQFWRQDESQGLVDIAVGDLDRNGLVDMHVSNYTGEPVSLYINRGDVFRDLNNRYKLARDSTPMVGFGSQAIDYTNNGWLDLLVTNGHVEDLESKGQAFRQPIQLFANLGHYFQKIDVPDSTFWADEHLGRALSRLDFEMVWSILSSPIC